MVEKQGNHPLSVIPKSGGKVLHINLDIGEGILFNGQECPHYRNATKVGTHCVSLSLSWSRSES